MAHIRSPDECGRWLDDGAAQKLLTHFDASDVVWLRAYCHLLMAIAEFPLAHDWQRAFDITFPSIFHMPKSAEQRKIRNATAEARARLEELGPTPPYPKKPYDIPWSEWDTTPQVKELRRQRKLRAPYEFRPIGSPFAEMIAFIHLTQWPVIEPHRMANVLRHFEGMVVLSRENWKRILAETDNRNEWIPNPAQTGVLSGIEVDKERVDGWQRFLNEFEAMLKGNKLIPHWWFDEGINLRRMFLEPHTFDIVLLIHGFAAVPYLEKGPVTDQETWREITQVFGGDFLRYFIWFN
ncbi:MAG: hypothetical protein ACR2PG_15055 [Hyphomicrobiaceae bacterium]